jgi:hypothetical protein
MSDALTKKKADRFRFLNRLYEVTDGDIHNIVDLSDVGADIGLSSDQSVAVMNYLQGEHLAKHQTIGGGVSITHYGVKEVEQALSHPDAPTQYFPPVVNIINVRNMVGSQIQQGTHDSTQHQNTSISQNDAAALQALVRSFREALDGLPFDTDTRSEAEAELLTVEAQLKSSKPKPAIVRESLKTLRNLLEGVASNALAAGLLPLFAPLAALMAG